MTPRAFRRFALALEGARESGAWGRAGCTRVILKAAEEDAVGEALTLAWQNTKKHL